MLRLQYNWMLAERFQWWEENPTRLKYPSPRKCITPVF
ncbi:MAG: helix-turn-helix domain-containing protein [Microcoleus sp.]